ncbi:MAG TPA: hypothetical protein PKI19_05415 [Elusimicrobiales bacterium]|nr:hypothetical protein [Elusimicrobiales bacterium]
MKLRNILGVCAILLAAPALYAQEKPAEAVPSQTGLAAGYRATALPVPGHQLLYVKEGDRIDLLVTFEAVTGRKESLSVSSSTLKSAPGKDPAGTAPKDGGKEIKEKMTATILQNIVVLNVRKPAKLEDLGAIELLLNPNEAQYAALSVAKASNINISVRAPGDTELHPMEMASFRRLIR